MGEPHLIVEYMNSHKWKQLRLELPTTTFFVQINYYGKWETSLFQILSYMQEMV